MSTERRPFGIYFDKFLAMLDSIKCTGTVRIDHVLMHALRPVMQPVHVVESKVSQEMQSNCYYHFMICVRPSSHMNVPPPLGTMSLKRSTQRRACSDESRKWVNQLPSL
jgi:hypothetical protein